MLLGTFGKLKIFWVLMDKTSMFGYILYNTENLSFNKNYKN